MSDYYPKVIIPSMGRARIIMTNQILKEYLVCVPESQAKEYEKELGTKHVLAHPDNVLAKAGKVNWLFDTFRKKRRWSSWMTTSVH